MVTPPAPPTATTLRLVPAATVVPAAVTAAPSASVAVAPKLPEVAKAPVEVSAATLEKLRNSRKDRRQAEVTRLQQRWGELVSDDRAKAELTLHAQRAAYLQRIRALAERANDFKLVQSVDELITQEERRDAARIGAYQG